MKRSIKVSGDILTIKDFMEVVDYRVTEGSQYGWSCFGDTVYQFDSWNGDQDGFSVGLIFDTQDQTVYEMSVHDYRSDRSYRWHHPNHREAYIQEAKSRNIDPKNAYDTVDYVDLETVDDILEKSQAIVNGELYDTRVQVPLTLPDDSIFTLMKMAHEQDITLNQLIENILRHEISQLKGENLAD